MKINEKGLKSIIAESLKKVLNEASYDANGNFDAEAHNSDLTDKFKSVLETLEQSISNALSELSYIQNATTDENIRKKARIVLDDLVNMGPSVKQAHPSAKADRSDI